MAELVPRYSNRVRQKQGKAAQGDPLELPRPAWGSCSSPHRSLPSPTAQILRGRRASLPGLV